MGAPRLVQLEAELPETATILGIDEYTACTIDLAAGRVDVFGNGAVTTRRDGREKRYSAGSVLSLEHLGESSQSWSPVALVGEPATEEPLTDSDPAEDCWVNPDELVDLLVWIRAHLREAREWELADAVRDRLTELGIAIDDGRVESTWRRE
jgi:DNA-binding transcriptional ArsR family regulator